MGFGVGGNLPVDGSLFLEFVPQSHQSLLTLMSAFWPVGQFITSVIAWIIIPMPHLSCSSATDCTTMSNLGWRAVQIILGLITVLMVIGRILLFKLHESPKFLVSKGRYNEAVSVLLDLASMNEKSLDLKMEDFEEEFKNLSTQLANVNHDSTSSLSKDNTVMGVLFSKQYLNTTILIWSIWSLVALGIFVLRLRQQYVLWFFAKVLIVEWWWRTSFSCNNISKLFNCVSMLSSGLIRRNVCVRLISRPQIYNGNRNFWSGNCIVLVHTLHFKYRPIGYNMSRWLSPKRHVRCNLYVFHLIPDSYTPEVFPTNVRGTAVGIASSLGRITGCIAPLLTGFFMDISIVLPLYISAAFLCMTAICMALLPIETRGRASI